MNVQLDLGASVDIVSPGELDTACDGIKQHVTHAMRRTKQRPILRPDLITAGVCGGTATTAFSTFTYPNGSSAYVVEAPIYPATGRLWSINSVSIFSGPMPSSTLVGASCELYAGDPDVPDFSHVIGIGTQIPVGFNFSRNTKWMHSGMRLFALVYGASVGTNIILCYSVTDYEDSAVEASMIPYVGG